METKTIFEIPIYYISKDEFDRRWNYYRKELYSKYKTPHNTKEVLDHVVHYKTYPNCLYKFNHIIGYIVIKINRSDIFFDIYECVNRKRFIFNSNTRYFVENIEAPGLHFRIVGKSDAEIKSDLQSWLSGIIQELPKKYAVDLEVFHNLIEDINLEAFSKRIS